MDMTTVMTTIILMVMLMTLTADMTMSIITKDLRFIPRSPLKTALKIPSWYLLRLSVF